jgi:arylsulfatase
MLALALAAALGLPPDFIALILVDALRADHVGAYGYARSTTPNLDRLAAQGTRYERAYVNAPWTRPSAASFLTGLHASHHRTESAEQRLPESVVTLATRLRSAGYRTGGFTANGNGGSLAGLERGFDTFEDPSRTYPKSMRGPTYCCNGLPTGEFLVQRAQAWLAKAPRDKTFLFLFLVDPHDPYGAPPHLERMFLGPKFAGTPRRHANWEYKNDYPAAERFSLMALYDAGIRYADDSLGKFFDFLRAQGIDQPSVFVSADHGEGFGEHGFYLHAHHFWEELLRVPLVVASPHIRQGVDPRLAQGIDVPTTICAIAEAECTGMEGRDLRAPALAGSTVISEYNDFGIRRQAILDGTYKVIWQRPADEAWFMRTVADKRLLPSVSFDREVVQGYHMKDDPQEHSPLAPMPARAHELLARLRRHVSP